MYKSCYRNIEEILLQGSPETTKEEIRIIMEDGESPLRNKTLEAVYQGLEKKDYAGYNEIAKSGGNISKFSGYQQMRKVLDILAAASPDRTDTYRSQVEVVSNAVGRISSCSHLYAQAFAKKVKPIVLEYNAMVAACIEATTALMHRYVDFIIEANGTLTIGGVTTKRESDTFYIEQLRQFINIPFHQYRSYLQTTVNNGSYHFLGTEFAVGITAIVVTVALTIVPVTRKVIYSIQDIKRRISDMLKLQAYFLELNETVVSADMQMSQDKKDKVLKRQAALRLKFLRLAESLQVQSSRNIVDGNKSLEKSNENISIGSLRDEIDSSDIVVV